MIFLGSFGNRVGRTIPLRLLRKEKAAKATPLMAAGEAGVIFLRSIRGINL